MHDSLSQRENDNLRLCAQTEWNGSANAFADKKMLLAFSV